MATTAAGTQQLVCPYLPPEIWHRILYEHAKHTTRTELWTLGRKVCSPWRAELAKVFAKKYLENVNLVQIEPDFGASTLDGYGLHMQQLRSTFIFNRYKQDNKLRCVFIETLDSITKRDQAYDGKMFAAFEEKVNLYLGTTGSKSARFDLPPCRIRVGPRVNDTELPNLAYDSQKREISFEWEGMFTRFFHEAAALERLESRVKDEAKRWLDNDGSIAGSARGLAKRHMAARRTTAKRIRRMRIKDSYLEHHGVDFKDDRFNEEEEHSALERIDRWQDSSFLADCADCTENPEEKLTAKSLADYWQSLKNIDFTPDTTDYGALKVEGVFSSTAIERLVHPRPGSDDPEDVMDYDTMVDIYYEATPPYEGPWFDDWGNEIDEEGNQLDEYGNPLEDSEEEEDAEDVAAEDVHRTTGNGCPPPKVGELDEWEGLSDWEEEQVVVKSYSIDTDETSGKGNE